MSSTTALELHTHHHKTASTSPPECTDAQVPSSRAILNYTTPHYHSRACRAVRRCARPSPQQSYSVGNGSVRRCDGDVNQDKMSAAKNNNPN
eukprot:scaffold1236_cov170-Ochromonas_danica.AAC.13